MSFLCSVANASRFSSLEWALVLSYFYSLQIRNVNTIKNCCLLSDVNLTPLLTSLSSWTLFCCCNETEKEISRCNTDKKLNVNLNFVWNEKNICGPYSTVLKTTGVIRFQYCILSCTIAVTFKEAKKWKYPEIIIFKIIIIRFLKDWYCLLLESVLSNCEEVTW